MWSTTTLPGVSESPVTIVLGLLFFFYILTVNLPFNQSLPVLCFLLQKHWHFNFMSIFQLWSHSRLEDWWISVLCFHRVWKGMVFNYAVCGFCLWEFIFSILPLKKNSKIFRCGVANIFSHWLNYKIVGPKPGQSVDSAYQYQYVLSLSWSQWVWSRSFYFPEHTF